MYGFCGEGMLVYKEEELSSSRSWRIICVSYLHESVGVVYSPTPVFPFCLGFSLLLISLERLGLLA